MELSPFSLNPFTSSSSCNFIKNQSVYLFLLQSQTQPSVTFKALKFRISCSQRVVQVDTQHGPQRVRVAFETTKQRKKRKPKPSFFEQIRDKWSAKLGSQREKFPWQEDSPPWQAQQEQDGEEEESKEEEDEEERHQSSDAYLSGSVTNASFSDSVSFGRPSSVISAPWAHGIKPFKRQVESEPETPPSVDGFDGVNDSDVKKPSRRVKRDFQSKSNEISEERPEREISLDLNGFTLGETPSGTRENVNLVSSGYDSGASELELGEGEKVRRKRSNTEMAEKMLPEHELKRLRNVSLRMLERTKVGAAGITQALVDAIHEKWKLDEVVKLKFEEHLSLNMRRTHAILEVSFRYIAASVISFL